MECISLRASLALAVGGTSCWAILRLCEFRDGGVARACTAWVEGRIGTPRGMRSLALSHNLKPEEIRDIATSPSQPRAIILELRPVRILDQCRSPISRT
jgi:hypothetical protein